MNQAELFPFVADLSPRARKELGALVEARASPGQVLLSRGEEAHGAYLVLHGGLRVYYLTEEGREATLYRVEPGDTCVLALSATLRSQPYPAWVEAARTGSRFVRIPHEVFHRFVEQEPAFRAFVLEALSGRIFELMGTLEQVATATVVQRVAGYLMRNGGARGEVGATQAMMAADLGTAREVVFRALRDLTTRGLVATARGRVRILDARGLAQLASAGP